MYLTRVVRISLGKGCSTLAFAECRAYFLRLAMFISCPVGKMEFGVDPFIYVIIDLSRIYCGCFVKYINHATSSSLYVLSLFFVFHVFHQFDFISPANLFS